MTVYQRDIKQHDDRVSDTYWMRLSAIERVALAYQIRDEPLIIADPDDDRDDD